jgi:hypothetical protein
VQKYRSRFPAADKNIGIQNIIPALEQSWSAIPPIAVTRTRINAASNIISYQ